jgi:hypothetical protein
VTALEAEFIYLVKRAMRDRKFDLANQLVLAAFSHNFDLTALTERNETKTVV